MIYKLTNLNIEDNSGGKAAKVIHLYRKNKAKVGDKVLVTILKKDIESKSKINKGDVLKAVIINTRDSIKRKDGTTIKFDNNNAVILKNNFDLPNNIRINTIIPIELRKNWSKLISLTDEIM